MSATTIDDQITALTTSGETPRRDTWVPVFLVPGPPRGQGHNGTDRSPTTMSHSAVGSVNNNEKFQPPSDGGSGGRSPLMQEQTGGPAHKNEPLGCGREDREVWHFLDF